jgi:tRNA-binding EMAP/Myf-like protein
MTRNFFKLLDFPHRRDFRSWRTFRSNQPTFISFFSQQQLFGNMADNDNEASGNIISGTNTNPIYSPFVPLTYHAYIEEQLVDMMKKVQIKVGRMISVERHPNAEKLYVEKVDFGEAEPLTVVSGLVPYLTEAEMLGRDCLFVTNLKPAA